MFDFTEEHMMIRKMMRRWTTDVLEPETERLENQVVGDEPYDLFRDLGKTFGIISLAKSAFERMEKKQSGGDKNDSKEKSDDDSSQGMSAADPALAAMLSIEMSRVNPGFMLSLGASIALTGGAIMSKGTWEQKKRWGLPILTFDKIGGWGMTEPHSGSDAFRSMRTTAKPTDGGYILKGSKTFITNAPAGDIFVIYAKIDHGDGTPISERPIEAFVVERGDKGIETSKPMKKFGMHTSPTGEVFLEDCFVPSDRLLGMTETSVDGRSSGKGVFHTERTGAAPMAYGIIERCLELSIEYSKERESWGNKIATYQLVQQRLTDMFLGLENVKNLMFKQIWMEKNKKSMTPAEASATKLYCGQTATNCGLSAIQLFGGNGYTQEYKVERLTRDAKLMQIGGGTDDIQIINIARHLLK